MPGWLPTANVPISTSFCNPPTHLVCRYIVKQLSRSERQSFLEFAPDYFR